MDELADTFVHGVALHVATVEFSHLSVSLDLVGDFWFDACCPGVEAFSARRHVLRHWVFVLVLWVGHCWGLFVFRAVRFLLRILIHISSIIKLHCFSCHRINSRLKRPLPRSHHFRLLITHQILSRLKRRHLLHSNRLLHHFLPRQNRIFHHHSVRRVVPEIISKDHKVIDLRNKCFQAVVLTQKTQELFCRLVIC